MSRPSFLFHVRGHRVIFLNAQAGQLAGQTLLGELGDPSLRVHKSVREPEWAQLGRDGHGTCRLARL